jgi:hypothetical protein
LDLLTTEQSVGIVSNMKAYEAGKGDHRYVGRREYAYDFTGPDRLLEDFWRDVEERRRVK